MTLVPSPPRYRTIPGKGIWHAGPGGLLEPIRQGEQSSWRVYALQRALNVEAAISGDVLVSDGNFGMDTRRKLKNWQERSHLLADGVAGGVTQGFIIKLAGERADTTHGLPSGTGRGYGIAEGAGVLAATNWSIPPGVDCGVGQYRLEPPFKMEDLKAAFRVYHAIDRACDDLRERQIEFMARNKHLKADPATALKVAVLAHNWPFQGGADLIVATYDGKRPYWRYVSSPDNLASWVSGYTRAEWAKHYPETILQFTV